MGIEINMTHAGYFQHGDSDFGDFMMLTVMLVAKIGHQHLKLVSNRLGLQHPSSTMQPCSNTVLNTITNDGGKQ